MADSSSGSILSGGKPAQPPSPGKTVSLIPEGIKTGLLFVLLVAVVFLLYDSYRSQRTTQAQLAQINEQIKGLEKSGEARITALKGEISDVASSTQEAVGSTKAEFKKTAQQIQLEGQRTKAELNQAIASKADSADVQAFKTDADSKFGQVKSEVGGVKNEVGTVKTDVGTVKTDLQNTRRELEGTQRQLVDVRETLTAAVAKNAAELDVLRRRGERDYYEFTIPKKNQITKVEDIRVSLKKTDPGKGKFSIDIMVDDNRIEKKDRNVNEPLQFLVGKNRLRYELVINWIQKDRAGGYLSIPKDKTLSSEKTPAPAR